MKRISQTLNDAAQIPTWLVSIVADAARETEWLDMLSQLEYVGCRKIFKAVPFHRVDASVLQHASEEALHALLFKRVVQIRRGQEKDSSWNESALSEVGFRYFSRLDQKLCELVDKELHYPLVSWIVEQRVLAVYPAYLAVTRDRRVRSALKQILAQEVRHASQFHAISDVVSERILRRALRIEQELWSDLESDIEKWLGAPVGANYLAPVSLSTH